MLSFQTAAGTVIGREHVRVHKNNQDAYALKVTDDMIVAAVCDGCSSGVYSELGARFAANWLVNNVGHFLPCPAHALAVCVGNGLSAALRDVLVPMSGRQVDADWSAPPEVVKDYALFTMTVLVMTPEDTIIFGLGDGTWCLESTTTRPDLQRLDSGPKNAPKYLGYRLLSSQDREHYGIESSSLSPELYDHERTEDVTKVLIGTDGVDDLEEGALWDLLNQDACYKNPSLLTKRLIVLGEQQKRLKDDTTIVMVRRVP